MKVPDTADHLAHSHRAHSGDLRLGRFEWVRPRCLKCQTPFDATLVQATRQADSLAISAMCERCLQISTYLVEPYRGQWQLVTRWHPEGRPLPDRWRFRGLRGSIDYTLWRAQVPIESVRRLSMSVLLRR